MYLINLHILLFIYLLIKDWIHSSLFLFTRYFSSLYLFIKTIGAWVLHDVSGIPPHMNILCNPPPTPCYLLVGIKRMIYVHLFILVPYVSMSGIISLQALSCQIPILPPKSAQVHYWGNIVTPMHIFQHLYPPLSPLPFWFGIGNSLCLPIWVQVKLKYICILILSCSPCCYIGIDSSKVSDTNPWPLG